MSEALLFAEHGENMLCTKFFLNVRNNFCTEHVLPRFKLGIFMYWTCDSMNNLSSYYGLWVSSCKNKSFWQRFTCILYIYSNFNVNFILELRKIILRLFCFINYTFFPISLSQNIIGWHLTPTLPNHPINKSKAAKSQRWFPIYSNPSTYNIIVSSKNLA